MKLTLSKIVYLLFASTIFISVLFLFREEIKAEVPYPYSWHFCPAEGIPIEDHCWFDLYNRYSKFGFDNPTYLNPNQEFQCKVTIMPDNQNDAGDYAEVHCAIALCDKWVAGCAWSHWEENIAVFDCIAPSTEDIYLLIGYDTEADCDTCDLGKYLQVGTYEPPIPAPRNPSGSCSGSSATVSWSPPDQIPGYPGPKYYDLRVDNTTTGGWRYTCDASAGDFCVDIPGDQNSYSFSATPGHTYRWWVSAVYECYSSVVETDDEVSELVYGDPFTCAVVNNPPYAPAPVAPPHNTWINYNPNFQARVSDPDGGNVRAYFSWPANRWGSWVSSGGTSRTGSIGVSDTSGSWWRAYARDPSGATSGWSGWWLLKKDRVNPSRTLDQENGTSTDTSIWVNLSESDDRSGVAVGDVDVRINGGSWTHYSNTTSNFTYTGSDGNTYEFRYRVQDNAGNWSSFDYDGSVTIQLSPVNQAPNTPTLVAPPHNTWINYNPNFQARVSDPDGGNVRAYFSSPASRWGGWVSSGGTSSTGSIGVSDTSGRSWRAYAQDPDGATSSWSGWRTLKKDTVVPSRNIDQENGTSTNTSIWVNLTESDARSGVAVGDVDVRINGGSWTHYSNTTSNFTYTGSDGNTYEFRYRVQDNAGNWSSFDYDGSVTIQLPPPTGTISGYVWEDTDEVCPVGGSKYANQTNVVTISPGPVSANTDANGYYEFTSVPFDTSYQVTVNKPADWSCACASGASGSCTKTVVVDASTPNPTVDFSIIHISAGWFQVIDGDIHAEQDIDNPVP